MTATRLPVRSKSWFQRAESAVAPHGALESAAVLLAQAAGSQRPLTLPARHDDVVGVHRLLLGNPASGRFGSYRELEVTAHAAHDPRAAGEFVAATLGPLADDNPAVARLRETLRVYLDEADNAPRAAARLYTHRNTVLKRIARATELLGYEPGQRRLAVELALELRRHLQPPSATWLRRR